MAAPCGNDEMTSDAAVAACEAALRHDDTYDEVMTNGMERRAGELFMGLLPGADATTRLDETMTCTALPCYGTTSPPSWGQLRTCLCGAWRRG
jgi:hypothetical protein